MAICRHEPGSATMIYRLWRGKDGFMLGTRSQISRWVEDYIHSVGVEFKTVSVNVDAAGDEYCDVWHPSLKDDLKFRWGLVMYLMGARKNFEAQRDKGRISASV
jgi:hypothetical protein